MYLCDNCDIAGFINVNLKRWASDLNSDRNKIEGALKGLKRGLLFSDDNEVIFVRNFLKHQKNLPINTNNKAHLGILKRFDEYKSKFGVDTIEMLLSLESEGGCKGLQSPIGIGNGNGIGNGIEEKEPKKFKKPTIDEIRSFILEKNYSVDADRFFNFYESKGWLVGKSPMKNWKAAVANWASDKKQTTASTLNEVNNKPGKL